MKSKLFEKRSLCVLFAIMALIFVSSVLLNILAVKPYIKADEFAENQTNSSKTSDGFVYRIITLETGEKCAFLSQYCGEGKELKIPEYIDGYPVKLIDSECLSNCDEIVSVEIPEGVLSLGDYVFAGCVSLEKVIIYSPTMEIGSHINIDSPLAIVAPDGSTAQQYASDNNIEFQLLK